MEVWGGNQAVDSGVSMVGLDAWVYSKPYGGSEGGGDVYYVSSCATGRITRLLVADVSGHGAEVSDVAVGLRTLMRKYVNHIDQTRFVRSMNEKFTEMSQAGLFATAVVTSFFSPTRQLLLCNAGHPPPLVYQAGRGEWHLLKESVEFADASNIPLGIMDGEYQQFDVRLGVGDLVLCYTDSLIEARGDDGELLGTEGLLKIVRSIEVTDANRVVPDLLAEIGKRCEGNLCSDDVTVMLFRPNGLGQSTPLRDRILAPLRVLRNVGGSVRKNGGPVAWPEVSVANLGGAIVGALNWVGRRKRA